MRRVLWLALAIGCSSGEPDRPPVWIVVEGDPAAGVDASEARFEPTLPVARRVEMRPGVWAFAVEHAGSPRTATVGAPGACPTGVQVGEGTAHVRLRPWIEVDEPIAQIGFGAPLRLEVRPGCREAIAGRIEWRQVSGPSLGELSTDRNGFVLRARMPSFESVHDGDVPWGIVPLSPRTRAQVVLEATWHGRGSTVRRTVRVAAAPRATGLPSVPVGGRVLLGGAGWRIAEQPRDAHAELAVQGALTSFVPDVVGTWRLSDAEGRALLVRAGRYDDTPLDCGRSECHGSAAEHAQRNPMTSVLARGLEGALGEAYTPSCAIGCHAAGEPGLPDGGFAHVARAGGFALPAPHEGAWDALPVALQRLGGVGCLSCHGPGAIPAPASRWAILRSDVCAVCHDAPPRYGHVVAWGGSRMARADADLRTREEGCRRCHTTAGYLARIGVREDQRPPDGVGPLGIACGACHAPHGENVGVALLRDVPPPESVDAARARRHPESLVCTSCHAPIGEGLPAASTAALVLAPDAVHADVEGGCVGCHRGGPDDLERGASHRFAVDPSACAGCHEGDVMADARALSENLSTRARSLWSDFVARGAVRLSDGSEDDPPHARRPTIAGDASIARAAHDVALVLEDPAAGAHAPAYARRLLDTAQLP